MWNLAFLSLAACGGFILAAMLACHKIKKLEHETEIFLAWVRELQKEIRSQKARATIAEAELGDWLHVKEKEE